MDRGHVRKRAVGLCAAAAAAAMAGVLPAAASTSAGGSFIGGLSTVKQVSSTIPANGDVNPYGVAIVPKSHGRLTAGDVLVSNFNNAANQQGTGTTIVEISPGGHQRLFATIPSEFARGRADHGAGGAALGLGHRRQPADGRRDVRDHEAR